MSRWVLLMSIVLGAVCQPMDETVDHISLLQTNAHAMQSRTKLEKTDLSLAPQGWSDAFLQEDSKTDLSLAPQGWLDAQNMNMDVSLRLAPRGFSNATNEMDHKIVRSGFFDDCGSSLHHVTECTQCNINFCAGSLWQTNSASAEAGYALGASVPVWGCNNVPTNPYVVRNSGTGAIYVASEGTGSATSTLHHVTACNQCGVNFCVNSLWQKNSGNAEAGYIVGSPLPSWGCGNLPANPYVLRNSGTGAIYVAEMKAAGTLHWVTSCNQCGYNFCYESRWKLNSANAEAGYIDGPSLPDWGCSNSPETPYIIRNSGTGAIYVVEMESVGTLHHVTECNQCGVNFCGSGLWKENSGTAEAGYSVGDNLPTWGCNNLPANPYVIRNSGTGAIYVVEVCQNVPTPTTTTTTTVVSVEELDDDMSEGESEQAGEIADQQLDIHECKKWCNSKKHKNKPWDQKCEWYACSGCSECNTATSFDFTNHDAVKTAFLAGQLVAHSKISSADASCPAGQTAFWCQNGNPSMSTDGYDYCGDNTLCPANVLQNNWNNAIHNPGDRVDGNCCYCGACLSYQA